MLGRVACRCGMRTGGGGRARRRVYSIFWELSGFRVGIWVIARGQRGGLNFGPRGGLNLGPRGGLNLGP